MVRARLMQTTVHISLCLALAATCGCTSVGMSTQPRASQYGRDVGCPSGPGAGVIASKGSLLNGRPHGNYIYYYPSGAMLANGMYDSGTKVGYWQYRHHDGDLLMVGQYNAAGLPEGLWILLDLNGKLDLDTQCRMHWEQGAMFFTTPEAKYLGEDFLRRHQRTLEEILPPLLVWNGTGVYEPGKHVRRLTDL